MKLSALLLTVASASDKCWRKMPTGCDRTLGESGSNGNGLVWFVDPHSSNEAGCDQRENAFNGYCDRTDAETHYGASAPTDVCWRKMPTGCDKTLGEPGSNGNGLVWFVDPHAATSAECDSRENAFNNYCDKFDALTYFGHVAPADTCWRKMPTGCDRTLSEPGSNGNGLIWFVDLHAHSESGCDNREDAFNGYCDRTDALTHYGHEVPDDRCWRKMPTGCDKTLSEPGSNGNGLVWFVDPHATTSAECDSRENAFNNYCGKINSALSYWGYDSSAYVAPVIESIDVEMDIIGETVETFTEDKQNMLRDQVARELGIPSGDVIITVGTKPNPVSRRLAAASGLVVTITIKIQPEQVTEEIEKLESDSFATNIAAATGITTTFKQFKPAHGSSICATCKWINDRIVVTHYLNSQEHGEKGLKHRCWHNGSDCKCKCANSISSMPYKNGEAKVGRITPGPRSSNPGLNWTP